MLAATARRPVASLSGPASTPELPVLAPEVQLLHRSRDPRPRAAVDFAAVVSTLDPGARRWLRTSLLLVAPDHPWLDAL